MRVTKESTDKAIETALKDRGAFMNIDGIAVTRNGVELARWLKKCGYTVVKYYDAGINGVVILDNGVKVYGNGYTFQKPLLSRSWVVPKLFATTGEENE